jgi:hypothetical protein
VNEPLHQPDLNRRISAGRENAPDYKTYLQSSEWRRQRDRALTRAAFRCERCSSKRRLHVHHLSYERLGHEWDQDLEVLCETCHQGEHFTEPEQTRLGVYLRLASAAVEANPFGDISDLSEAIKVQCVELKIPVNITRIADALSVCGLRLRTRPEPRQAREYGRLVPVPPLTDQESRDLLSRLSILACGTPDGLMQSVIRPMPSLEKTAAEQRAHEERLAEQIAKFKDWPV